MLKLDDVRRPLHDFTTLKLLAGTNFLTARKNQGLYIVQVGNFIRFIHIYIYMYFYMYTHIYVTIFLYT